MTHEQLAAKMDAAFTRRERERRFSAALLVLRRNPTLRRTLRAMRRHVERANAGGRPVDRAKIARSLGVSASVYEKRFSLIKTMLGIRL